MQMPEEKAAGRFRHVQAALGWALAGLLLTRVLIYFIGFVSPFWGVWRYPGKLYVSHNLLEAWQPITPWFSVCFAVAGWHLAMAMRSLPARVGVVAMYALVPVAVIGSSFARRAIEAADAPVPPQGPALFAMLSGSYLMFATVAFVGLAWWSIRRTNQAVVLHRVGP